MDMISELTVYLVLGELDQARYCGALIRTQVYRQ